MGVLAFLCFLALGSLLLDLHLFARSPFGPGITPIIVDIQPGQGFQQTALLLHQKGIIKNPLKFRWLARLKGYDKKIQAGEYVFSAALAPNELLEHLGSGRIHLHKLTVPEGFNLHQIAALVAQTGWTEAENFLARAMDPELVRTLGINADTFEGYLFPDTYYFPKATTADKIISAMLKRFQSIFTADFCKQAKTLGLSIHQVVTLASIIEKETGMPFERPIISSVFHNRLKKRIRLESDPTVIYGLPNFDGNLTRKHLKSATIYNTYIIRGLPPGPIANPGLKSIEAALYPADTAFLYFVSKKDRTHHFSTNLRDHNTAVRKYQLTH